jgi:hypothetical protein
MQERKKMRTTARTKKRKHTSALKRIQKKRTTGRSERRDEG